MQTITISTDRVMRALKGIDILTWACSAPRHVDAGLRNIFTESGSGGGFIDRKLENGDWTIITSYSRATYALSNITVKIVQTSSRPLVFLNASIRHGGNKTSYTGVLLVATDKSIDLTAIVRRAAPRAVKFVITSP